MQDASQHVRIFGMPLKSRISERADRINLYAFFPRKLYGSRDKLSADAAPFILSGNFRMFDHYFLWGSIMIDHFPHQDVLAFNGVKNAALPVVPSFYFHEVSDWLRKRLTRQKPGMKMRKKIIALWQPAG